MKPSKPIFASFLRGASYIFKGAGWFTKSPGLMFLGLVPGIIVGIIFLTIIIILAISSGTIVSFVTPFAESWDELWKNILRISLQIALVYSATVSAVMAFVGVSLMVGEPVYEKIWKDVEKIERGVIPTYETGWKQSAIDGATLAFKGILVGVLGFALGFIPLIGNITSAIITTILNGRVLAEETTSRSLVARGYNSCERKTIWKEHKWELLGFGVATQLFFLIPFGPLLLMPSAVSGSTLFTQKYAETNRVDGTITE